MNPQSLCIWLEDVCFVFFPSVCFYYVMQWLHTPSLPVWDLFVMAAIPTAHPTPPPPPPLTSWANTCKANEGAGGGAQADGSEFEVHGVRRGRGTCSTISSLLLLWPAGSQPLPLFPVKPAPILCDPDYYYFKHIKSGDILYCSCLIWIEAWGSGKRQRYKDIIQTD